MERTTAALIAASVISLSAALLFGQRYSVIPIRDGYLSIDHWHGTRLACQMRTDLASYQREVRSNQHQLGDPGPEPPASPLEKLGEPGPQRQKWKEWSDARAALPYMSWEDAAAQTVPLWICERR